MIVEDKVDSLVTGRTRHPKRQCECIQVGCIQSTGVWIQHIFAYFYSALQNWRRLGVEKFYSKPVPVYFIWFSLLLARRIYCRNRLRLHSTSLRSFGFRNFWSTFYRHHLFRKASFDFCKGTKNKNSWLNFELFEFDFSRLKKADSYFKHLVSSNAIRLSFYFCCRFFNDFQTSFGRSFRNTPLQCISNPKHTQMQVFRN